MRSVFAAAAAVALMLGATACGGSGTNEVTTQQAQGEPPARPTGTLKVALPGAPQAIDPTRTVGPTDLPIVTALYDGLLRRTPDDFEHLSPALATSWKSNSDASEWTFKLRRGVKFSDGAEFNAAAAKKSMEYYQREGSILAFTLGPVSRISTPDEFTLVLSYEAPFPDLETFVPFVMMISPKLLEGPADVVEKRVASNAAGTGPYILDRFSSSGDTTLHANPHYWGGGPHIEKLEFRPIPEESARTAALQAGDVDLVMRVSPQTAGLFSGDSRFTVSTLPSWTTRTISMPTQKKPFDDVRVRRAFAYAIDPERIAKTIMRGQATVTGSVMPPGTYGFRRPETQYSYDPAKAKALLKEAGLSQPVPVTLVSYSSVADFAPIAQALAEQARAGGFDVKVVSVSEGAGTTDIAKPQRKWDLHLIINGWANGGPLHLASGGIVANASYRGKRLLDLINKMNSTPNGPEREKIIGDAQEEVAMELPDVTLFATTVSDVSTPALQNHVPPIDGFLPNWSEHYLR